MKKRLVYLAMFLASLVGSAQQSLPNPPPARLFFGYSAALSLYEAAASTGGAPPSAQLPNPPPASTAYGYCAACAVPYQPLAVDPSGNFSAGAILGVTIPPLAQGALVYSPTANAGAGGFSWSATAGLVSTQSLYVANNQATADSLVSSANSGLTAFGDSIPAGVGATATALGYVGDIAADYGIQTANNQAVSGDKSTDMSWHVFTSLNPADTGNPIVTASIGTNDVNYGSAGIIGFSIAQYASATWAALSTTNKVLAGAAAVTPTGSTSADTTFANAAGVQCTTGTCTLTYSAQIGPSGVFYLWYSKKTTGGSITVTAGGSAVTDTISGSATLSGAFSTDVPTVQTVTPSAARFAAARGAQTIVVTMTGPITVYGFGFPPTTRYRGTSGPRFNFGNVPPQQTNANATNIALYNAADLKIGQTLVGDGLDVPLVDINANVDYGLDWSGSATQNCPASTSPGFHPNNCGHRHIAGIFESVINATAAAPSKTVSEVPGDVACAMAADTSPLSTAITGGTSTSLTGVLTSNNLGFYPTGTLVGVTGASPSGLNGGPYTTNSTPNGGLTLTFNSLPATWTSGGTMYLWCGNQTQDAIAASKYVSSNVFALPANYFSASPGASADVTLQATTTTGVTPPGLQVGLYTNGTTLAVSFLPMALTASSQNGLGVRWAITSGSPTTGLAGSGLVSTDIVGFSAQTSSSINVFSNQVMQPHIVGVGQANTLFPGIIYAATGVASIATSPFSGCTVSGTTGQTVNLTAFNNSSTATATITLSASVTAAALSPANVGSVTITSRGTSATAAPTTATCSAGTAASASGTATFTSTLGGSPGNFTVIRALTYRLY